MIDDENGQSFSNDDSQFVSSKVVMTNGSCQNIERGVNCTWCYSNEDMSYLITISPQTFIRLGADLDQIDSRITENNDEQMEMR